MSVIRLSPDTYLSTKDGIIITEEQATQIVSNAVLNDKNLTVQETISIIHGRDNERVDLLLKGANSNIPPTQGFLVKVYLSSSQGLQRVYKQAVIDPADGSVVRGSYEDYLDMEFDV